MGDIVYPYELTNGATADADEVMANFNQIKNNFDTDTVQDASANLTEMQSMADPYPLDVASLPVELRGEIKRLRWQLDALIGKTNWYEDPDTNLLLEFNKGADIVSATALTLGVDGNYFDVTGTTAITSIATRRVGSVIKLHFDGILTLTHHATDLVLPGGANITTAAGDEAEFFEYATGDWRCTSYGYAAGGSVAGGNAHDHSGGDGAVIPQGGIGSLAIGQAQLKTGTGTVLQGAGSGNHVLPGGAYGFYPRLYGANEFSDLTSASISGARANLGVSPITSIFLDCSSASIYASQRFIQSSPPYKIGSKQWEHFLYMLVNGNGDIVAAYESSDPPYAYNGPSHNAKDSIERIQAVPHPFLDYFDKDPSVDGLEIVLVDLRGHDTKKWKTDNAKKGKGMLEDLGHINKKGKIVTPQEVGIGNIQGFTNRVKIRKHN